MDIKNAAIEMKRLLARFPASLQGSKEASKEHIAWMLNKIADGSVSGEKAHRWLGYTQGVVCCLGVATLQDVKSINHNS